MCRTAAHVSYMCKDGFLIRHFQCDVCYFLASYKLTCFCPCVCYAKEKRGGRGEKKHALWSVDWCRRCGVPHALVPWQVLGWAKEQLETHTQKECADLAAHCNACKYEPRFSDTEIIGGNNNPVAREILCVCHTKKIGDCCISELSLCVPEFALLDYVA